MKRSPNFVHLFAILVAIVSLFSSSINSAKAQSIPPGTPPDIAVILRKVQAGGRPTMAEIAKLQAWSQSLIKKANNPSTIPQPRPGTTGGTTPVSNTSQGIPCQVAVTLSYEGNTPGGDHEVGNLSVTALATLFPRIDGTDDYWATLLNPNTHVSSFQIVLPLKNGQLPKTGSGTFSRKITSPKATDTIQATFQNTAAGFTLTTTGQGDDLFGLGGIGGELKGTQTGTDADGSHTQTISTASTGTIGVTPPFAAEAAGPKPQPGTPTPRPTMNLSYRQLVAAIRSGRTSTVSGSEHFDFEQGGTHYQGTATIAITLRPTAVKLIIEPVDAALYKKWIPMPDAEECQESKFFGTPKPLQVHVVLNDASRATPHASGTMTPANATIGGRMKITLKEVSSVPGFCMNDPYENPKTQEGLFFPKTQPAGIKWLDDKNVQTLSATATSAIVNVASRDTASYGNITARCESLGLDSEYPVNHTPYLSLPLDNNANHIADQWEKDNNIYSQNFPADWDEEGSAAGWKTKGDGLTLFEEYRGFIVEPPDSGVEKFQRLPPGKRKLFIFGFGADKQIYKDGATLLARNIVIDVYFLHNRRTKTYDEAEYPKWMNFNKTPFTKVSQCAVWMYDFDPTTSSPGYAASFYQEGDTLHEAQPQCPQTIRRINISRRAAEAQVDHWIEQLPPHTTYNNVPISFRTAAENSGRDLNRMGNQLAQLGQRNKLVKRLMTFVVMHELGHAIGGRHHGLDRYLGYNGVGQTPAERNADDARMQDECYSSGNHSCPMRYWHADTDQVEVLAFLDGSWDLTHPYAGGRWEYCDADKPNLRINP